jgi:hypothetical protein
MELIKMSTTQNIIQEHISLPNQVSSLKAMSIFKIKRKQNMISLLLTNIQEMIKTTLKKVSTMDNYKSKILQT